MEFREKSYVFAFDAPVLEAQDQINALCKEVAPDLECRVAWSRQNQADWLEVYRQSIQPVRCGDFWIRPSWHAPSEALTDIVIDPGLVFGTGHHETTCGCIEAIASIDTREKSVLDVGCGSGILAIAAALGGAEVSLCDTDKAAIMDSYHNCEINNIPIVKAWVGSADQTGQTYDIVIANIVADVLIALRRDLERIVKEGGTLVISGILSRYRSRIEAAYGTLETVRVIERGEWLTFIFKKTQELNR